jgi:hypothetical protein
MNTHRVPQTDLPYFPDPNWIPQLRTPMSPRFFGDLMGELWISKNDARIYFGLTEPYYAVLKEHGNGGLSRNKFWVSQIWEAVAFHQSKAAADLALLRFVEKNELCESAIFVCRTCAGIF